MALTLAIVGAGPRGVSLLERIGSALSSDGGAEALEIHIVEDTEFGAGRVWRTDQPRELCMNTLAAAVTLFTDESVIMAGPVRVGPNLFEWAVLALATGHPELVNEPAIGQEVRAVFASHPIRSGLVADYFAELASLRPESHPSRALYGEYTKWCYQRAIATLPVTEHHDRAVGLTRRDGKQQLQLARGTTLSVDAIVITGGWLPRQDNNAERRLARRSSGLLWVRPDNPIEQNLADIRPGEDVIVRGMGMGFFDTMALLTLNRGGTFAVDTRTASGLRYLPSGREPVLHATSTRGIPYRAKSSYGGLPPRAPQRLLREVDWVSKKRPLDFDAEVWPLIVGDAYWDYYNTLHRVRPSALRDGDWQDIAAIIRAGTGDPEDLDAKIAAVVPEREDRFELARELDPIRSPFPDAASWHDWVTRFLVADLREAEAGRDSALKAGLWSIASARRDVAIIGSYGGFTAESMARGGGRLRAFGGMVGSGPPAFRSRQLLALTQAGLVRFIGPAATVTAGRGGFTATSKLVGGSTIKARVLVDAWLRFHDAAASADPLIEGLYQAGRLRAFQLTGANGARHATGGVDVDPQSGAILNSRGVPDPTLYLIGIPLEETLGDTAISPMPGSNATMLRETDRVAGSVLRALTPVE